MISGQMVIMKEKEEQLSNFEPFSGAIVEISLRKPTKTSR